MGGGLPQETRAGERGGRKVLKMGRLKLPMGLNTLSRYFGASHANTEGTSMRANLRRCLGPMNALVGGS